MGLKEGTLESLVESGADASAIANSVFLQMLRALEGTFLRLVTESKFSIPSR